jgi:hypothetical protein
LLDALKDLKPIRSCGDGLSSTSGWRSTPVASARLVLQVGLFVQRRVFRVLIFGGLVALCLGRLVSHGPS